MIVAEIRLASAGGNDQAVVLGLIPLPEQLGNDVAFGQIDLDDITEQHLALR